jgi:multidrug resistance protein, MATE family
MQFALVLDHIKKNFKLGYPVMLSQLGHVTVWVADSIMVGQVGAIPLAAAALGNSIVAIILTFGIGVSFALTPLVAQADGEKNVDKARGYLQNGLVINLLVGVLLFVITLASSFSLYFLHQPENVVELAIPYMAIVGFSLLPFMLFQTLRQFAEGLSLTKQAMYITIGANMVNVGLNYVLIFGKAGFPALGLNGAGIATLISRLFLAGMIVYWFVKSSHFDLYRVGFALKKWSNKIIREILKIGLPTGLQFIFEVGAFSFAAIMVGWLGAKPLAAHQIAISLASVSYMMATGISAAATIRVGNQLGMGDIFNLRMAGFTCFLMGVIFMSLSCVVFILGNAYLPTFFVNEDEVIQIATGLIIIAAFFQLSDGVQVVGLGALRGLGDVKVPTLISLLAYWGVGLPLGYVLCFKAGLGADGVWYGLLSGLSIAAILIFIRFHYISKRLEPGSLGELHKI